MIDISTGRSIDSRGPILIPNRQVEVAPGRVEAKGPAFSPANVPAWPGRAQWVWLSEPESAPPTAALFRRSIDLTDAPKQVNAWISADTAYRLYINGRLVDRGPDDIGRDHDGTPTGKWFINFRDLTPFFKAGENIIAVEVFNKQAMPQSYVTYGHGGLLFEAEIQLSGSDPIVICSDDKWRGIVAPQWKMETSISSFMYVNIPQSVLCFDAEKEPQSWLDSSFDDSSWPICEITDGNDWSPLLTSEIPPCVEATYPFKDVVRATEGVVVPSEPFAQGQPVVIQQDGSFAVRFDRVLSGIIGFRIKGGAGALLEIQPNELNEPGFHRMAMLRPQGSEFEFEYPNYDSFSVINIRATNVTQPIEVLDIRANFTSYPVEYRGSFSCSDPHLNRMWEISRWLTQICLQTLHLDSPHHQEPIGDPGDYLIESLNNYYTFGSPSIVRQDLRKYAWLLRQCDFKPFHISYALLWVQWLLDYADYTNDFELVRELAPEVHELLDTFTGFRGENGLICNPPNFMFMDWVEIGEFAGHHPPAVIGQGYMTAFYYRALADARRVAELMDDSGKVDRYTKLRHDTKQAYYRELWDGKVGLFRDGKPFQSKTEPYQWLPADKDIETHTAQNNTLAVLYDLVPKTQQAEVMQRVLNGPNFNCQPYFMHFVFDALHHCGLFEKEAIGQMKRWNINEETQSFPEMWDSGDYSHAWQCSPLYQLSARVLGVTPLEPGFAKVAIAPQPCGLDWAKGEVPTPHGIVSVEWQREEAGLKISVRVPQGVEAVVSPAVSSVVLSG